MEKFKLTDEELELIEVLRNVKNSRHNYSEELEEYARELFERFFDFD